jgi:hypothetical protein
MTKDQAETSAPQDAETQAPVNSETPAPQDGELLGPETPSTALVASPLRQQLLAATAIPDIKTVADKSATLRDHARRAQDRALFDEATEVLKSAQLKAGQQLTDMRVRGERASGHGDQKSGFRHGTPKLADLGITKKQSADWQALARLTEQEFAAHVERCKSRVVEAAEVEQVQFPRRTTPKAHPRPAKYPRVSRKFATKPSECEVEANEVNADERTDSTKLDNAVEAKSEKPSSRTSKLKPPTKTAGRSSRHDASLPLRPLQFKTFQAQLCSEATRLLATIQDPPADLMAHLRNCVAAITGLVERGYKR